MDENPAKITLDFAMLKISTSQSGHVTILCLTDWLNFSVASIEAEKDRVLVSDSTIFVT